MILITALIFPFSSFVLITSSLKLQLLELRFEDIMSLGEDATPINLLRGVPNPSLLPAILLRDAAFEVLNDKSIYSDALVYGPDPGYEPLRESIAQCLTEFFQPRAGPVIAQRICITGGASQNLGCMLNVYTDPAYTRKIWIVAPAYFLAFRIFEDAGFAGRMRAIPEDEGGLDIEFLRREIRKSEEDARKSGIDTPKYKPERTRAKVYKHVVYCVPTFANPSSRTMSLGTRKELVRLAREFDALVVCDDVYDFLQWPSSAKKKSDLAALRSAHLPRVVDIDRELDGGVERKDADGFGNVCSNGSFAKIVGPGVRVGWVEGSERFAYGVSQTYVIVSVNVLPRISFVRDCTTVSRRVYVMIRYAD
jgi:DNA-binding transcriptional MocR family regulator